MNILFYISGHGFGHAVRQAELISALKRRDPNCTIKVRCSNSHKIIHNLLSEAQTVDYCAMDSEIKETDSALKIDVPNTLARLKELGKNKNRLIQKEVETLQGTPIDLMIADIPFLAGEVANTLGVPVVGISNFTWDWILEPHLSQIEEGKALLSMMREGYAKFDSYFRLPFGHATTVFKKVENVPMLSRIPRISKEEARNRIGIKPTENRPIVLIAMREALAPAALKATVQNAKDFLFVSPDLHPIECENLIANIKLDAEFRFTELLQASDIVVGKLGYGIVSEAITAEKKLLFPTRSNFRETALLQEGIKPIIQSCEISAEDFFSGTWKSSLEKLNALPFKSNTMNCDGAQVIAEKILSLYTGRGTAVSPAWEKADSKKVPLNPSSANTSVST